MFAGIGALLDRPWPGRCLVLVSPSHGENRGSSPLGSANDFSELSQFRLCTFAGSPTFLQWTVLHTLPINLNPGNPQDARVSSLGQCCLTRGNPGAMDRSPAVCDGDTIRKVVLEPHYLSSSAECRPPSRRLLAAIGLHTHLRRCPRCGAGHSTKFHSRR